MNPATSKTVDSRWIRFRAAAYLGGRGLSFGCGNDPIVPQQALDPEKYSLNIDVFKYPQTDACTTNLDFIKRESMDHVFIGARQNPPIAALIDKLRVGGHVVIHAVDGDPAKCREVLGSLGQWQEKDTYVRGDQFLGIWKLVGRSRKGILPPKPKAVKRACIARYGAIGDMIMITPLIRRLYEDGYEITMNITPYSAEVLRNNPFVSNIVLQERDMVPNQDLGSYWAEWIPDYDRYINLSESIEGKLLKVEGRRDFYTEKAWRDQICTANYYDHTLALGGYPGVSGSRGELYFSNTELKQAKHIRDKFKDRFMIVWSLKGSSHHKIYPLLTPVLSQWLDNHPDAIAVLVGAEGDKGLQFDHPQVVGVAGSMPIRDVFCLTQFADCVVGPESAVINAAGCFPVPKITMLSHSAHGNLCSNWEGDFCLQADVACSPCHQLHYSLESCPLVSIAEQGKSEPAYTGPICSAVGFPPHRIAARLEEVYNLSRGTRVSTESVSN